MENYLKILKNTPLFSGIKEEDFLPLTHCLSLKKKSYTKNEFIFEMGQEISSFGIIISGQVHILNDDFWGNRTIITRLEKGALLGESFACSQKNVFPLSVLAVESAEVVFLDYKKMMTTCTSACSSHNILINNMIHILANKNIILTHKMEHIIKRTTREKLLSYLSSQALKNKNNTFVIPFNRQELADFLSVDRSAMSKELCKMQKEGILSFHKNYFELHKI